MRWLHPFRTAFDLLDGFVASLLVWTVEAFDTAVRLADPGDTDGPWYCRDPRGGAA